MRSVTASTAPAPDAALAMHTFGEGPQVAIAVHGITASAMSWPVVARALPPDWTVLAPDLRGRGASAALPGPYGLDRHVADVCAIAQARGGATVLAGHSMGAYVALLAAAARPELFTRLVLIDGGLSIPLPPDADPDAVLQATLGPAIARLGRTFATDEEYLDVFRAHPALAEWSPDIEAYVRYDIAGEPGSLRSRVVEAAVWQDGREVLTRVADFAAAWDALSLPTLLLMAPNGMFGQPPGLLPADSVADARRRRPDIAVEIVPEANHYTLALNPSYAATVARRIADPTSWPAP
jgi:pimeloyl-ACP methyl ester carboxylesterase